MKVQVKVLVVAALLVTIVTLLHFSGTVDVDPSQIIDRLPTLETLNDFKASIITKTTAAKETFTFSGDDIDTSHKLDTIETVELDDDEVDPEIAATNKDDGERDLSSSLIDYPLPRRKFKDFAHYPPHNIDEPSKFAYATLLCTHDPHEKDPFYVATQSLVWRVLWTDWHSKYPMIVFVCPSTPQYQRDTLSGQGALVKQIELIGEGVIDTSELYLARWRDQLTKLNMWLETDWKRILFLDSDAFPIQNIDELFDLVPTQSCKHDLLIPDDQATMLTDKADELCQYTFGGTVMSHTGGTLLNGGVFVFSPSLVWHEKFMRDLQKREEYNYHAAEQGLLDSHLGFGLDGAFPRFHFTQRYNADSEFYLDNIADGDLKVLHCKMWNALSIPDPALNTRWDVDWMTLSRFYDGNIFQEARETGHRKEPLEVLVELELAKQAKEKAEAEGQ